MSEEQTTAPADEGTETAIASPNTDAVTTENDAPVALGEGGIKALKAERDARKAAEKKISEFEAKLQEIEDAEKSELQKALDAVDKFKSEAATATQELDRLKVLSETGLDPNMADFLTASDVDGMREQAERLAAATAAKTEPRTPAPDPAQGAKPGSAAQLTQADLGNMSASEIEAARKDGRLDNVLGIK